MPEFFEPTSLVAGDTPVTMPIDAMPRLDVKRGWGFNTATSLVFHRSPLTARRALQAAQDLQQQLDQLRVVRAIEAIVPR